MAANRTIRERIVSIPTTGAAAASAENHGTAAGRETAKRPWIFYVVRRDRLRLYRAAAASAFATMLSMT